MNESPNIKPTAEDVTKWLAEHGDMLYRYGLKRLGRPDIAEDLVQETFVSALRSADSFEGRSKVQTWLVSILRHKIADHLRQLSRQRERDSAARSEAESSPFNNGYWREGVKAWPTDPSDAVENQEFWQILNECHDKLPAKLGIAFRMRELEDLSMAEICETLEITTTNLSVRLHRARLLLRDCLTQNWFLTGGQS